MASDFERLQSLFSRASSLPELPHSVQRLIALIDTGEASSADLERIISSDPGLSVALLRLANNHRHIDEQISTIRSAVMLLGQHSVRNLATSWMMQGLVQSRVVAPTFSVNRYARHCMVTAQAARYLVARRQLKGAVETTWTADEVFAAALLHDIGIALMACVAPECYQRVYAAGERLQITLAAAFEKLYGSKLNELGAAAIRAWGLPLVFEQAVFYYAKPWLLPDQIGALACINYADYLASISGSTLEKWAVTPELEFEVESRAEIHEEEAARVLHLVNENAAKQLNEGPNISSQKLGAWKEHNAEGTPWDILVAEDNKVNQNLISLILDHFGYTYRVVSNGEEAVQAFVEKRPDLVLMDIQMPALDGFLATKEIRSVEKAIGPRNADHRPNRQGSAERSGTMPGRRHGRLFREAPDDRRVHRKTGALAAEQGCLKFRVKGEHN